VSLPPASVAQAAREAALKSPRFDPPFDFKVCWANDYEDLFRDRNLIDTDPEELMDRAFKRGRVLLQAAGGTGKTSILSRLRRESSDRRIVALYVDLRRWRPEMFSWWEEARDSEPQRLQLLLDTLTSPTGVDDAAIDLLGPSLQVLLMVDGLNELPSGIGDSIISVVDGFARRHPRAGVIATDRLVRRPISDSHWTLATIAPLGGEAGLGGIAFFRNLAIAAGETSSVSAYGHYLTRHVNLRESDLALIGEAAFSLYASTKSRTFALSLLEDRIGNELVDQLRDGGTLVVDGDLASFFHHLIHDYLASVHMARDGLTWDPDGFDVITLTASSFDSLAMVLEQLHDANEADRFLRRIYDWSFYGAAYALATCRGRRSASVSEEMEIALLAMLAERRWDPIRATAQQVSDALALFPSGVADSFLDAPDLQALFGLVERMIGQQSSLRKWATLFTRATDSAVEENDIAVLEDSDSLLGWTMANVLKRSKLSEHQLDQLIRVLADSPNATTRWRAAHALGAHPSRASINALFAALDDTYHWVAYGSVRSLIEIAALSSEHREGVISRLRNVMDRRRSDASILRQLSRAVILAAPPEAWADSVGPIVEDLWAAAETEERQDYWRRVAYELWRTQQERDGVA